MTTAIGDIPNRYVTTWRQLAWVVHLVVITFKTVGGPVARSKTEAQLTTKGPSRIPEGFGR
jgi:hypothetical protein